MLHIKDQNWFAVGLDVIVVIVGIFLGMQVTEWNEERKDRAIESSYLKRIAADLETDLDEFKRAIDLGMTRQGYGEFLIASIENPNLVIEDPSRFISAISRASWTYAPTISDHTYEEMKSSGELSIIRDVNLRTIITRYYADIKSNSQWSYVRQQLQNEYLNRAIGILNYDQELNLVSYDEDRTFSLEDATAAYQRMIEKPKFLEWLPVSTNKTDSINTYQDWSNKATEILDLIQKSNFGKGN